MIEDVLPAENGDFPNVMLVFQGRKYIFLSHLWSHVIAHVSIHNIKILCIRVSWERQIHTQTYQYYGH